MSLSSLPAMSVDAASSCPPAHSYNSHEQYLRELKLNQKHPRGGQVRSGYDIEREESWKNQDKTSVPLPSLLCLRHLALPSPESE